METDFAGRKLVAFRRAPKRGRGDGDSELIDDLWRYFDIEMKKKNKNKRTIVDRGIVEGKYRTCDLFFFYREMKGISIFFFFICINIYIRNNCGNV